MLTHPLGTTDTRTTSNNEKKFECLVRNGGARRLGNRSCSAAQRNVHSKSTRENNTGSEHHQQVQHTIVLTDRRSQDREISAFSVTTHDRSWSTIDESIGDGGPQQAWWCHNVGGVDIVGMGSDRGSRGHKAILIHPANARNVYTDRSQRTTRVC